MNYSTNAKKYSMNEILDYIKEKNWTFKEQGNEYLLQRCPFCQDEKYHFFLNKTEGVFMCHKCQEKGNLWHLRKSQGDVKEIISRAFKQQDYKLPEQDQADKYHSAIENHPKVVNYLNSRNISRLCADRFNLGVYSNNGEDWLSIPNYQSGKLVNIKFRSLPPAKKTYRRTKDCKSILFNCDVINSSREIYITEGEIDAITLLDRGLINVIGATNGAGAFDAEWIDQLKKISKIYICYDPDEAGQKGAKSLAKRLGYNRCYNVVLPKDVNDFFLNKTLEDFKVEVTKAHRYDLKGVISLDQAVELLKIENRDRGKSAGLMTEWESVNKITKGFNPGDFIIVAAPPKIGKTTFCLEIARYLARMNNPVLFYCLEMRPERLARKIIQSETRAEEPTDEQIDEFSMAFQNFPLYFGHSFKKTKLDEVLGTIRDGIKRYDLKIVFFDNLHWLVRSTQNVNEEIGQAAQGFKLLAEEMEIPIVAIAQPRKRESNNEIMTAQDLKYSNALHSDCDQLLILHRNRKVSKGKDIDNADFEGTSESLSPALLVRGEAHRFGSGGETVLHYHGAESRFEEMDKTISIFDIGN